LGTSASTTNILGFSAAIALLCLAAPAAAVQDSRSSQDQGESMVSDLLEQTEELLEDTKEAQLRDTREAWEALEEEVENWEPGQVDYFRDPEVRRRVLADLEGTRRRLSSDVDFWTQGDTYYLAEVDELNQAVAEAIVVAEVSGLDVEQLTAIHNATKRVIRTASFEVVAGPPPDEDTDWVNYFKDLFGYAFGAERDIESYRAKLTQYKVALYKKATVAYIRALVATFDEAPECAPNDSVEELVIEGIPIGRVGCPDPALDHLRAYGDAIRTIQSADVDAALSQVEELIKQQQLVADLSAIVPLLGESIDMYQVYSGETLAGRKLSAGERAFITVFLTIPIVGHHAAPYVKKYLGQAVRRSPKAAVGLYDLTMALEAQLMRLGELTGSARGVAPDVLSDWMARQWGTALDGVRRMREHLAVFYLPTGEMSESLSRELAEHSLTMRNEVLSAIRQRNLINQDLRNVAVDRLWIHDAPAELLARARESSEELISRVLMRTMPASQAERIARSGIVDSHALALLEVARKRDEIYLMRPVNLHAGPLMETLDAGTKGMGIKNKSASHGIIAGALPVDQSLNKLGSQLDDLYERKLAGTLTPEELAKFSSRVDELTEELAKGRKAVAKCLDDPSCAKAVPFTTQILGEERTVMSVKVNRTVDGQTVQRTVQVIPDGNRLLDPQTGNVLDIVPTSAPEPVMVLADPQTGRILTADYDVLNYGQRGRHSSPTFNKNTGYITASEEAAGREINEAVARRGYRGGNVVHHGAERNFLFSPGVDYPITAFEGSAGRVVQIDACDLRCMERWCDASSICNLADLCSRAQRPGCVPVDPDRLLKDYFHSQRLAGYNLDPNPVWGWGNYNGLSGWFPLRQ